MTEEQQKVTEEVDLEELFQKCYLDDRIFAKVFFPDRFTRPFDPIHDEMFEVLTSDSNKRAIAAPRGIGKTSIASFLRPVKKALYCDVNYIVIISATASSAMEQTENMKQLLMRNEMVERMFGNVKTRQWSKERWVLEIPGDPPHQVCVMPRGAGQQIRGKLFLNSRPDYICGDDIEDPDDVKNPRLRKELAEWWYSDVWGSVDRAADNYEINLVGTVLHEDSLLIKLLRSERWKSKRLELFDDNYVSNAPNWKTDEECRQLVEEYKEDGQLDEAMREYRNLPVPPGEKEFHEEDFKYYNDKLSEGELNADPTIDTFIIIDPKKSSSEGGSEAAIVGVSVDTKANEIYYRRIKNGFFGPQETIDKAIVMAQELNAQIIAIEDTGLKEFATFPIKNELSRRGLPYQVLELSARGGNSPDRKEERVAQITSFYHNGLVYHNRNDCEALEQQLLQFPRPHKWDVMDAAAYVPQVLEKGEQFMVPTGADGFTESREEVEAEFEDLEKSNYYHEPMNDWRSI